MIMYDRQTESWWQHFTGEAIIGSYTGTTLVEIKSNIISFNNFQKHYPIGLVLSRKTGFTRQYGKTPYFGYDIINNVPFLMRGEVDGRLPPMERIFSVALNQKLKLYPFTELASSNILHDEIGNSAILIFKTGKIYSVLDQSNI